MKRNTVPIFGLAFALTVGCGHPGPDDSGPAQGASESKRLSGVVSEPLAGTTSYSATVQSDAPVGYWRLGERTGGLGSLAADSATPAHPGTYVSTYSDTPMPTLDEPGALVGDRDGAPFFLPSNNQHQTPALQFSWIDVPNNPSQASTTGVTVELWLTLPSTPFSPGGYSSPAIKTSGAASDGYGFFWLGHTLYFYINSINIRVGVPIPAGTTTVTNETTQSRFHHLVGTYDPTFNGGQGQIAVYFDGVQVATRATPDVAALVPGPGDFTIAHGWLGGWYGKVDEVALYNKPLSTARIQAHYQAAIGAAAIDQTTATGGDQVYARTIVAPPLESRGLAAAVTDLQTSLNQMTGSPPATPFNVVPATTSNIDSHAIRLIRLGCPTCVPVIPPYAAANAAEQHILNDLNSRNLLAFGAISDPTDSTSGLKIFSQSDGGLTAGIYYYLRLLGARWLLPNDRWTIMPSRTSVRWNTARVESPDFQLGTSWFASGGFQVNEDGDAVQGGYPDTLPHVGFDASSVAFSRWELWNQRNLLIAGFAQQGHLERTFNSAAVFQDPPAGQQPVCGPAPSNCNLWRSRDALENIDAFAPTDAQGLHPQPGDFGWHVSNIDDNGFQSWFANTAMASFAKRCKAQPGQNFDPNVAGNLCVSTELPDSVPEDRSSKSVGAQSGGAGAADNAATLANYTAGVVAASGNCPGRYACYLAYHTHTGVPSVTLAPNVFVSLVPYGETQAALNGDAMVQAWGQSHKATNLGVYDYWGPPSFRHDLPSLDMYNRVPQEIRLWKAAGVNSIYNESTGSAGAVGLPLYLTGQLAWNTKILDDKLRAELLDEAFGPLPLTADGGVSGRDSPSAEMRALVARWAHFSLQPSEIALDIQSIISAYNGSVPGSAIRARIVDFGAYVHYLALYYKWSLTLADADADPLILYLWQIHDRMMVQTVTMMGQITAPSPAMKAKWALGGTGYTSEFMLKFNAPQPWLADIAIMNALTADAADPTFTMPFQPVTYTGSVGPAPNPGASPTTTWFTTEPDTGTGQPFAFYARPGTSSITFWLAVPAVPPASAVVVNILDPNGTPPEIDNASGVSVGNPASYSVGGWTQVTFKTAIAGLYSMSVSEATKNTTFQLAVQDNQPFAAASFSQSTDAANIQTYPNGTRAIPQSWFYAPPSTGFAISCHACPALPLVIPPANVDIGAGPGVGVRMSSGYQVYNSGPGGLWNMLNFKTDGADPLYLVNIPSYLSPAKDQVLTQGL